MVLESDLMRHFAFEIVMVDVLHSHLNIFLVSICYSTREVKRMDNDKFEFTWMENSIKLIMMTAINRTCFNDSGIINQFSFHKLLFH